MNKEEIEFYSHRKEERNYPKWVVATALILLVAITATFLYLIYISK